MNYNKNEERNKRKERLAFYCASLSSFSHIGGRFRIHLVSQICRKQFNIPKGSQAYFSLAPFQSSHVFLKLLYLGW